MSVSGGGRAGGGLLDEAPAGDRRRVHVGADGGRISALLPSASGEDLPAPILRSECAHLGGTRAPLPEQFVGIVRVDRGVGIGRQARAIQIDEPCADVGQGDALGGILFVLCERRVTALPTRWRRIALHAAHVRADGRAVHRRRVERTTEHVELYELRGGTHADTRRAARLRSCTACSSFAIAMIVGLSSAGAASYPWPWMPLRRGKSPRGTSPNSRVDCSADRRRGT
jgi:hypothetical protein